MDSNKPTILVTGISGNLGLRLLPQLLLPQSNGFHIIGVDIHAPHPLPPGLDYFEEMDLGREASCARLVELFREFNVSAVIHLAFVIDPVRTGILEKGRMWQINVCGTARVMEAIAEFNRLGGKIEKFIFPSSVSAYGPETPGAVKEDHPLSAHTLTYAIHKKESDKVAQYRAASMGACTTFILRPHIFTGSSMQNYLVGALRGTPTGKGKLGAWMRKKGIRLPMMLPMGKQYLEKRFQFVHVDDMGRLLAHILRTSGGASRVVILNVAASGESLPLSRCVKIAQSKLIRLPSRFLCILVLKLLWRWGISAIPPEAFPYMAGSYTMDTTRLQKFLGKDYSAVIRYSVEEALADSFQQAPAEVQHEEKGVPARS